MADGHMFNELVRQKYTTKLGTQRTYTMAHLHRDLQKGYLRLKMFAHDSIFTVEEFKQLKMTAKKEVSDLIESIFHIYTGDNPTSEKEALMQRCGESRWHSRSTSSLHSTAHRN